MKSFVTGVDGFIGRWLAELLVSRGDDVFGLSRNPGASGHASRSIVYTAGDLRDADLVADAIRRAQPDRVFHLAALNNIALSFAKPEEAVEVNVLGTLRLVNAMVAHAPKATLVSVGSSAEYGDTARVRDAVMEEDALLPSSPYGISKAAQGLFVRQLPRSHKLRSLHVRPFAIVGPGKTGDAMSSFAQRVVAIEEGGEPKLSVGNLTAVRDFIDVRDCVDALVRLSTEGETGGVYNVCTGKATKLSELVEAFRQASRVPFAVVEDPAMMRPVDDARIVGNPGKLAALGFAPSRSFTQTVEDTLASFRRSSSQSAATKP